MYKVIIQTTQTLPLTKSPIHTILNLKLQQTLEHISQQITQQTLHQSIFKQISGKIHLLRNLNQNNNLSNTNISPQTNIISNVNFSSNISQNTKNKLKISQKSRALLLINPTKSTLNMLQERLMQIQLMYKIKQYYQIGINNNGVNLHIAIIFKSIAIAQQVYAYLRNYKTQQSGIFYIESVCVTIVDKYGGLGDWKQMLIDQQSGKQIWAEIPHCEKCLQILQPQITGIEPKPKTKKTQQNQILITQTCLVCIIREKQHSSQCSQCSELQDNWVCMVCGVIGCGRYKNADAYKHYVTSKHILSLDLKTHRIWNYKLDCFSHRVNRDDGTVDDYHDQQKVQLDNQQIQLEFWKYCNVVSQQLDRQRNFYQKIKQQQIQRFTQQQKTLQQKLSQMDKLKQQKKQNLKKKQKKNKKIQKRFNQLEQQCKQQRELTKYLQQSAKNIKKQSTIQNNQGKSPIQNDVINKKRLELKRIQQQIQQYLLNLTGN